MSPREASPARADEPCAAVTGAVSPRRSTASGEQLRRFVDQLPAVAALFDDSRHCLAGSGEFRSLYGTADGTFVESRLQEQWPEWPSVFAQALAGGDVETEVCWSDAGGQSRWSRWVLRPWRDDDARVSGVMAFYHDITGQKQAETNLLQVCASIEAMNQQLEEAITRANSLATEAAVADQAKSTFLAMMSHEIRTPLNGVIGMANILEHTPLADEQREYLRTIRVSGEAVLGVINDILDHSKIEAGHLELENEPFDLGTCVEEVLELLASKAFSKGLELAAIWHDGAPRLVRGDAARVRQILINLIANAVKFTERGEVVVEIRPVAATGACAANECALELSVRDTGPGIPAERQDRLFQAYAQLDRSAARTQEGTGLGLAISRRLAELMGGRLWVESREGEGATFRFHFPTTPVEPAAVEPADPGLRGKRALLVEDNASSASVILAQARACGIEVDWVRDRAQACARLAAGRWDFLIVDELLPDGCGFDLPAALAADRRPRWTIAYSLLNGLADARHLDVVLNKPVKPAQLVRALRQGVTAGATAVSSPATVIDLGQTATRAPLSILLAEDNPVNQRVALLMLSRLGYQARVVVDGAQAVAAVEKQAFDVVLMDVQMPVLDGLDATRRIREVSTSDRAPWIIALTAAALRVDRERALGAGMNDFLTKPLRFESLQAALARAHAAIHDSPLPVAV